MATTTTKPIHSLVIDAGPIIKNDPAISTLVAEAEVLYTIPAVVEEIRDPATRSRVETTLLPFITLRSPVPASIKIISEFARKTGDLEVLSRPDIHLMALAYELECERNHGDWRLRSVPGQKRLNGAPPTSVTEEARDLKAEEVAKEPVQAPEAPKPAPETRGAWGTSIPVSSSTTTAIEETLKNTHLSSEKGSVDQAAQKEEISECRNEQVPEANAASETTREVEYDVPESVQDAEPEIPLEETQDAADSDDGEWITPSNLKKHQAKDANGSAEPLDEVKTMQVALITSDFAMQNVMLRMNLNLLSPSLQRIRQLKTWVLRCHACFHITKDMSKQFCGRCGKDTLLRTSCSTDKDGNFQVHLKKNMQWNTRGNVYSIPKPVAGTSNGKNVSGGGKGGWGQHLILAEDQKEYIQAMTTAKRKKERNLMDEDYLPSILTGERGRAGGRPKVGAGKTVNSRKRH